MILTTNLSAVLPIGIPLGWSLDSEAKGFIVRRGGSFCYLDAEAYQIWGVAFCGPDPNSLVRQIALTLKRDLQVVSADISRLIQLKLLIQLVGDWRDDWLRMAALRVIPRAAIGDSDQERGYQMLVANGKLELRLGRTCHSIWAHWDGISTIEHSVNRVAESSGCARRKLRQQAHSLLVACIRAGVVFVDCEQQIE